MESKEQNSISGVLKLVLFTVLYLLINFVIMVPKYECKESECIATFNNKFQENGEDFIVEDKKNALDKDSASVFSQSTMTSFSVRVNGSSIILTDNTFGYISSIQDRYSVLQGICNTYIKELNLDAKCISQIEIHGKIESTAEKDRVSELKKSGEISTEIYNAEVVNGDLSNLKVKIKLVEPTTIKPDTIVQKTNDLYMGESTKIEGIEGKGITYKELTYNGLDITNEDILREDIVKPAVDSIIKVGTKNPYYDEVAFLVSPTKGGYISSGFGEQRARSVHKGIDIAKSYGEDVMASFDGKVISAGYNNGGYGNLIIIEHDNNLKTYYAHLSNIYVKQGDSVKKNDIIGTIGSTGNSTGPHLHFELRVNNSPVDPIKYILK